MKARILALVLVGLAVLIPAVAEAGRGRYANTPPMSPDGPVYDPALWKMAGYNPDVYDQLLAQKMMMLQQQAMMREQQALLKLQKQNGTDQTKQGKMAPSGVPTRNTLAPTRTAKKKHHTKKDAASDPEKDTAKKKDSDGSAAKAGGTTGTNASQASSTTTAGSTTTTGKPTAPATTSTAKPAASTAKPGAK
jgi:hypothetical protein